ncbi:MAG: hypothetical protein AB1942_20025 [Pseudomonadota bacterium]
MKARPTTRILAWSPTYLEMFDLVALDWLPPEDVRLTLNARRDRFTMVAEFKRPCGGVAVLTVVARRQADGEWIATRETARIRMVARVGDLHAL